MTQWQRSKTLFARARQSLAGGVNSNLRLLTKPIPLFFDHAAGAMVYDVDGNAYIDYSLGQGPMILGHSPPAVLEAVNQAMRRGQLYAAQHELEISVAEKLVQLIPCAELCRFGLSGSDMVQAAMRLARAVTGRTKILRFEGHSPLRKGCPRSAITSHLHPRPPRHHAILSAQGGAPWIACSYGPVMVRRCARPLSWARLPISRRPVKS